MVNLKQLKKLASFPLEKVAETLKISHQQALELLIEHNLYRGKVYKASCPSCQVTSTTLDKTSSICTINHTPTTTFIEGIFTLPNNDTIRYNQNSILEKEWLSSITSSEGLISIKNSNIRIGYTYSNIDYIFTPLFELEWETGAKWIVDIIDFLEQDWDFYKKRFEAIQFWAKQNGFHFRLISKGKIKYSTWSVIHTNNKQTTTPSYEWMMMNHAASWASLSPSTRLQVGAVISSLPMDQIYAFGYNGDELGGSNLSTCFSSDTFVHAEENCLLKCKTSKPTRMFITHSPCFRCAQKIINAKNIKEVYYLIPYRDMSGTGLLIQYGIPVYQFRPTTPQGQVLPQEDVVKHFIPNTLQ